MTVKFYMVTCSTLPMQMGAHDRVKGWSVITPAGAEHRRFSDRVATAPRERQTQASRPRGMACDYPEQLLKG
jgi:hypothetical protein